MFDAKSLLLVNNDKTKVFKIDVFLEKSVGTDQDINKTCDDLLQGFLLLLTCLETA